MSTTRTVKLLASTVLTGAAVVVVSVGAGPSERAGAPGAISYQGRVTDGGAPYDGTGYFKFAVVDAAGTTTYWSNDGTSTGGGEPTGSTPLTVDGGLFTVLLGDTSLANMTALTASVFDGTERYLRVWFSGDGVTFGQLSPDQRITGSPYALQATAAVDAESVGGEAPDAFADAGHAHDGLLPSGAVVFGTTKSETTLINAGFDYTGPSIGDTWTSKAAIPTPREFLAGGATDGFIYAVGGWSIITEWETANEAYDPITDSWTTKADMPTGRRGLAVATTDDVLYAIGGISASGYETVTEAYDPATDSWTTKADMPTGRERLAAAVVNGVVYAVGGAGLNRYLAKNEAYNPATDSWSIKTDMPTGREGLTAAAVDGVIYAIGGEEDWTSWWNDNEAYDPDADSWSARADLPTGRYDLAAAVAVGMIHVVGGNSSAGSNETAHEVYAPASNSWHTRAPMPTGRERLAAAGMDGVIYAISGSSSGVNEAYTPALYAYRKN